MQFGGDIVRNKKLLALVVVLVLILTVFAACNPKDESFSITKGWSDNLDEAYSVTSTDGLQITFNKAGADWASLKRTMAVDAPSLEGFTKLVMTVKMDNYSNNGPCALIVKIEYNSSTNPAKEVKFQISSTEQTYEWDLIGQPLTDALQMLVFVDAGCGLSSGTVNFSKFAFDKGEIASTSVKLPTTTTTNEYTSGTTFDFNNNWIDGGDFAYRFAKAGNTTTISYSKWGNEWSSAKVLVKNVQSFDYINLKVKGTAGTHAMFKIEGGEGAIEQKVTFDGTVQNVTIDFLNKTSRTGELSFLVFAMEGSTAVGNGTIEISLLEFSNTALVVNEEPAAAVNFYGEDPWGATWTPVNFDCESIYTKTNKNVFTFSSATSWQQIYMPLSGDFSKFTTVTVTLSVSRDMPVIAKLDGINKEEKIEGATLIAGQTQYVLTFDLSAYTRVEIQTIKKLIFFVDWDATEAGTITIDSVVFSGLRTGTEDNNKVDLINSAVGINDYQLVYTATGLTINFANKGEWAALGFALDTAIDYSAYTKIVIEYSATTIDGKNILVKVNGRNTGEKWENGIPASGTVTITLTEVIDASLRGYIDIFFAGADLVESGSITITAIYLTK